MERVAELAPHLLSLGVGDHGRDGAELDAETEHQNRMNPTIGPPRPMGERGAHMADPVGRIP